MKNNLEKRVYEAPQSEIVLMDTRFSVLMASVTPAPDSGIMGNGLQFNEQNGQW